MGVKMSRPARLLSMSIFVGRRVRFAALQQYFASINLKVDTMFVLWPVEPRFA
jgi:hypothetical protein